MTRAIGAGALLLAVAACGGGNSNNLAETANVTVTNNASSNVQQTVRNLPEGSRNGVLIRAIRDARFACQHVRESVLIETPNAMPVYMATCDDQSVYAIAVQDNGNMVVKEAMRENRK